MNYTYQQGKDARWSAGQAMVPINTIADANKLAAGQIKNAPTNTSSGACQGISMWWLIKIALGEDFWTWFGPPKAASPASGNINGAAGEPVTLIKAIMNTQAGLCSQPGFTRAINHSTAINYILAKTKGHLTNKRGLVLRENADWKTLGYEIDVAKGYCFIGFSRTGWGGHAVAAHICNDGSIEFFDPNVGEYDFPNSTSFFTWIDGQLGPFYGFDRLTTFELQTLSRPGA